MRIILCNNVIIKGFDLKIALFLLAIDNFESDKDRIWYLVKRLNNRPLMLISQTRRLHAKLIRQTDDVDIIQ